MISSSRLRLALQLEDDFSGPLLETLLEQAIAFVERQTHRRFGEAAEVTEVLRGNGTRHLALTEAAIGDAVTAVVEQAYQGATAVALAPDVDFVSRPHGTTSYLVRAGGGVWKSDYEYLASYSAGYDIDEGPKDIEALLVALVGVKITALGAEGLASETMGGYAYTRPSIHAFEDGDLRAIPGAVRTIDSWRQPVLA